jgi:DNA-binding transcriptional LysR family regulator
VPQRPARYISSLVCCVRVDVKGPLSADILLQLAIAGAGILRLSEHVVARSIHARLLLPLP